MGPHIFKAPERQDRKATRFTNVQAASAQKSAVVGLYPGPKQRRDAEGTVGRDDGMLGWYSHACRQNSGSSCMQAKVSMAAVKRGSNLTSRVRDVRRHMSWLAENHQTNFPTHSDHYTEQPRSSQGGAQAFWVLEEMAGTQADQRVTSSAVCEVVKKELLTRHLFPRLQLVVACAKAILRFSDHRGSHFRTKKCHYRASPASA